MWQRYNPTGPMPIYWLKVPQSIMTDLRLKGFHDGYERLNDININLIDTLRPERIPQGKELAFQNWSSYLFRESCLLTPCLPTIWHPEITPEDIQFLKDKFHGRLIEIEAQTVDEALHKYKLTKWTFGHFYHCACMGNWQDVVEEQLSLSSSVGLNWMYVGLLGTDEQRKYFESRANHHGIEIDIKFHHHDLGMFELPTMKLVDDWAETHPESYTGGVKPQPVGSLRPKGDDRVLTGVGLALRM